MRALVDHMKTLRLFWSGLFGSGCALAFLILNSAAMAQDVSAEAICAADRDGEMVEVTARDDAGIFRTRSGQRLQVAGVRLIAPVKIEKSDGAETAVFYDVALGKRGAGANRWGLRMGHIKLVGASELVAESWLKSGVAMVEPLSLSPSCAAALMELERRAIDGRRGGWSHGRIFDSQDVELAGQVGRYVVVEGVVRSVGETKRMRYLNFGEDWSKDFTATIDVRDTSVFAAAGVDIMALAGERVRLRGVIGVNRGPLIVLEHSAQLERLTMMRLAADD